MPLAELKTPKTEVQSSIVEHLEELLVRARAGEIESLLWFTEDAASRKMSWGASGSLDQVQMIGRLEIIRHTIVGEFVKGT